MSQSKFRTRVVKTLFALLAEWRYQHRPRTCRTQADNSTSFNESENERKERKRTLAEPTRFCLEIWTETRNYWAAGAHEHNRRTHQV